MMDIWRFVHALYDVDRGALNKIVAAFPVNQCHDALICGTIARLKRNQSGGREICCIDCTVLAIFSSNRSDHIFHIVCIARFVSASIHFTHNTAPEPSAQYVLRLRLIEHGFPDLGTDCSKRNELCSIRKITHPEDVLTKQKLSRHLISFE